MTDDLVTWLRAQLDEDARLIDEYDAFQRGLPVAAIVVPPGWLLGEPFDVDRQRAEVDAKRRIVDRAASITDQHDDEQVWYQQAIGDVLRMLALPYADRPGYRDEWAPEGQLQF